MNVAPAADYEAVLETGETGLTGTIALGLYDNQGATTEALSTAGIIETPTGSGVYAATRTAPVDGGQYTLVWSLDGTTSPDKVATDQLTVTSSAPFEPPTSTYGTVDELLRRLSIGAPTQAQIDQAQLCLNGAASEINWDLQYTVDQPTSLTQIVCYGRARELWNLGYATFGAALLASDLLAYAGNDSWARWHRMLDPLRVHEGIA